MKILLVLVSAGILGLLCWVLWSPITDPDLAEEALERDSPADVRGPIPAPAPEHTRKDTPGPREAKRRIAIPAREEPAPPPGRARLVVQIVGSETGAPVPGVRVFLHESDCGGGQWSHAEGSLAEAEDEAPLSDAEGRVEFPVRAGVEYCVSAEMEDESAGGGEQPVGVIDPGERREVQIAIPTQPDQLVYARVFDGETDEPIVGANVRLQVHRLQNWGDPAETDAGEVLGKTVTDGEGVFAALLPSWREPLAYVEAPRWSLAIVPLTPGHETPELALPVPLRPSGEVTVHVFDGFRDRSGLAVRLKMDPLWLIVTEGPSDFPDMPNAPAVLLRAVTGPDGRASLGEVPSNAPFEVEVVGDGTREFRTRDNLRLEPGERREFEVDLTAGTEIAGTLIDAADGSFISGHEIWLAVAIFPRPTTFGYFEGYDAYARTTTDSAGGFRFTNVPPGDWWVGPAATQSPNDPVMSNALAPIADYVRIPPGTITMAVDLETHRGSYLQGKVIDSQGQPAEDSLVSANAGDRHFCWTMSDRVGLFSVGPLIPAVYEVTACGVGGDADSIAERADATEGKELQLQLRRGARIAGRLLSSGEPVNRNATLDLVSRGNSSVETGDCTMWLYDDEKASFCFDGLLPGRYDLLASTDRYELAIVRDLVVETGEHLDDVELELLPGARLELSLAHGDEWIEVRVFASGELVATGWVGPEESTFMVVPPGSSTLRVLDEEDEILAEYAITVGAGESLKMTVP